MGSPKILLLDVETSPHRVFAWGLWAQDIHINQIVEPGRTLCWAAKWYKQTKVMFDSVQDGNTKRMLKGIYDLINEADAVVHYNGCKFDMPTLNQEFLKAGFGPPAPYKQIDLLLTTRARFRLPSNKMDYVARHLGLEGKVKTKGMDLWKGCMNGDKKSWAEMKVYNVRDLELLEEIYEIMLPWIPSHPNMGLYTDVEKPVCTNCGSYNVQKRGVEHTKTYSYHRFHCTDCGTWMRGRKNILTKEKSSAVLIAVK